MLLWTCAPDSLMFLSPGTKLDDATNLLSVPYFSPSCAFFEFTLYLSEEFFSSWPVLIYLPCESDSGTWNSKDNSLAAVTKVSFASISSGFRWDISTSLGRKYSVLTSFPSSPPLKGTSGFYICLTSLAGFFCYCVACYLSKLSWSFWRVCWTTYS